jgi:4-hydroxy-4-methyl-2-oxoglutarate aldolase
MKSVIYKHIPSCDQALVREAAACGVADLHEALGPITGRMSLMAPSMRALNPGIAIAGQAVTAYNYSGDNLMMHCALRLAQKGQVLVTSNGGIPHGAQWGEMATLNARRKGLAGIIVDGNIRDSDAIRELTFPIWSTWISPAHSEKRGPGAVNIPIVCAGALVEPGDIVVADGDGVLVVPIARLADAVAGAQKYGERETSWRERLTSDTDLFDLANIQKALDAANVEEKDISWVEEQKSGR